MLYSITCPYCRFPVQPLEACVICTHCRRVQHKHCWDANGRCASEGCAGEPKEWRPDAGKPPAARPATVTSAQAPRRVAPWPVPVALTLLIVWAVYQCVMLAHESGTWRHAAGHDLRTVSERTALLRYADPGAPVLAEIPARTQVQMLSVAKDYVRVQTNSGQVGYVPRNRLDLPPTPPRSPQ